MYTLEKLTRQIILYILLKAPWLFKILYQVPVMASEWVSAIHLQQIHSCCMTSLQWRKNYLLLFIGIKISISLCKAKKITAFFFFFWLRAEYLHMRPSLLGSQEGLCTHVKGRIWPPSINTIQYKYESTAFSSLDCSIETKKSSEGESLLQLILAKTWKNGDGLWNKRQWE